MKKAIHALVLMIFVLCSCQDQEIPTCTTSAISLASRAGFYCGTAVDYEQLFSNQVYQQIVDEQFNSVTAENIMKPSFLHPSENTYYWAEADQLADYCISNSKRLHGHTLIWHQQLPFWMVNYQGDKVAWENMFKDHIFQVVSHFKGKVTSWDVVNEAFNDDGTLRNTIWKEHLGSSYIEKAFQYAHEADPDAKLFYNDYSVAHNPVKRRAILNYFNNLRAKGVQVDGLGIQMHISTGFPENVEISNTIDEIWKHDYLIHISELDIAINPFYQPMPSASDTDLKRQADKYLYIFKAYNRIPTRYKFGITTWGVGDGDSWIISYYDRDDFPLLFDDDYLPKPAYCKLISNL